MGEGKTFMLQKICEAYNIELHYLSGSDLCGANEGDSKDKIKNAYEIACSKMSITKKLAVIAIDDFHLSIASDLGEKVSKTTNSQVLTGYLMNLADSPYRNGVRVPIIVLGNNFTNLYPALVRNGRMDFFTWKPSTDEKVDMVYYMYRNFYPNIRHEDVRILVNNYPNKDVAFFRDVIQDFFLSRFDTVVNEFEKRQGEVGLNEINSLIRDYILYSDSCTREQLSMMAYKRNLVKQESFEQ
jgi:AAA+ superfamily predicted ATPase